MSALDGFYSTWNKARETFGQGTPDDGSRFDGSSRLMQMKAGVEAAAPDDRWQGSGSQAYAAANKEHAAVYEKLAELDTKMAAEVKNAASIVTTGRANLDTAKGWVDSMVNSLGKSKANDREQKLIPIAREGISKVDSIVKSATDDMVGIKRNIEKIKGDYEALIKQEFGADTKKSDTGIGNDMLGITGGFKQDNTLEDQRRQNQIDAFKQMFGREPSSAADWTTAGALDPHSYNPVFKGVGPEIKVVKIRPVPGQGVVRTSQWIEQRDVSSFPPPKRDIGNNRGPDQNFDPEDTKVTMYIDYENGVVVMRQNPSVELNNDGSPGRVAVDIPTGSVMQADDGSVRIKYDSGNPFAPDIASDPQGPFADHQVTVNGDLVFTPGPDGVRVDGTRTDYPSLEVYQDLPDGTARTVTIDPAASGRSTGPALNLPFHHDVGRGGEAFKPFDTGSWNPRYDVPAPLPSTEFGPATSPPSVPPLPTGEAVPM